jgi:hypothetical protein
MEYFPGQHRPFRVYVIHNVVRSLCGFLAVGTNRRATYPGAILAFEVKSGYPRGTISILARHTKEKIRE